MTAADRAIALFIDDIDKAKRGLADEVYRLFPDQFVEVFPFGEEEFEPDDQGRITIKASDIEDCPSSEIESAFEEFDREIRRRVRELKAALQREEIDAR
jgi:hypothetical protein